MIKKRFFFLIFFLIFIFFFFLLTLMIFNNPLALSAVVKAKPGETVDFASLIKPICTLTNAHELSYVLHHFKPFGDLPPMDINAFKQNIKPLWEDKENIKGGKYIIRLKRETGQRIFERVLVFFLGEAFTAMEINGLVLSIRPKQFILGIWVKKNPSKEEETKFLGQLIDAIGIEFHVTVEFKLNDESLKDNSSFRNAIIHN